VLAEVLVIAVMVIMRERLLAWGKRRWWLHTSLKRGAGGCLLLEVTALVAAPGDGGGGGGDGCLSGIKFDDPSKAP
jgi:hypothetical protein